MRVDLFDFELPQDRIALRPARPRDSARLLLVEEREISDHRVLDLPELLRAGDVLVFNDTKVIPAQLEGTRGEASIGATLHKREGPREWQAFLRNAKRARTGDTGDHKMHAEWGRIDDETAERLNAVRASGGRLIAVGTTSLRLLESAATADGTIRPFEGDTAIFITPGYRFRAVDGLITNFHLPRSTLFMLVSALMGLDVMKAAYAHAIDAGYRFYSYGDGSLLLPNRAS